MHYAYIFQIFIGGLPLHVTPSELEAVFLPFGRIRCHKQADRGHAYVVFENGQRVADFLNCCRRIEEAEFYEWQVTKHRRVTPQEWRTTGKMYD